MQNTPPPADAPAPAWTTWLTPKEVGTKLNLSPRTIRRMIRAQILAAKNVSAGKQPRFLVDPNSLDNAARPVRDN